MWFRNCKPRNLHKTWLDTNQKITWSPTTANVEYTRLIVVYKLSGKKDLKEKSLENSFKISTESNHAHKQNPQDNTDKLNIKLVDVYKSLIN